MPSATVAVVLLALTLAAIVAPRHRRRIVANAVESR
jgi:hypothetical protein